MELTFTGREKAVGLFIIGILILLLATVILIGRGKDWFKTYVTYYTVFKESYNLTENTAVKLHNANIGKVKRISLDGNVVKIRLAIFQEFASRIRTDSVASVKSPTLIGSEFVDIKPGSPDASLIPEEGEIPSVEKKSLTSLLEEFQVEKTAKMMVDAIQNLSLIIRELQAPDGPLFSLFAHANNSLASIDRVVQGIKEGEGSLGQLLTTSTLIDNLQGKIDQIGSILENVDNATARTPEMMVQLQETLKSAQQMLAGITPAMQKAPQTLEEVQKTLRASRTVLRDITRTTAKLPQTIDHVQGLLISFKKVGDELLPKIEGLRGLLKNAEQAVANLDAILSNVKKGSPEIPQIINIAKTLLLDIRDSVGNLDKLIVALQNNILFRSNLPPEPKLDNIDAGLRK